MKREALHHQILIIGGGTAGITVAARLRRAQKGLSVAIVERSNAHYYQPLWTLVGAGILPKEATRRAEKAYIPQGVQQPRRARRCASRRRYW